MRTDREKHGLRGPVKKVVTETAQFEVRDGQITEKPWFSNTNTFNTEGQSIEQVNRNPDGSEWRTVNDYSDSGNLLSTRTLDPTGALNSEVRYIYDADDRLVAEQHISPDGKVTTPTTYTYDDRGRKSKVQELDSDGNTHRMIMIEGTSISITTSEARLIESHYDDHGNVIEVKVLNVDGALVSRAEVTRDERGNSLEETQYIEGGFSLGPCASDSCSTEELAALTEEQKEELAAEVARLFSPGTAMARHTHRYDTEGRLIESKLMMMGMEAGRQTFAYDEFGNRSEEVSYNENGTESKAVLTREYDEHGNWTSELVSTVSSWDAEFGASTPAHVTRRLITYW
jgi:RHS repeat protein